MKAIPEAGYQKEVFRTGMIARNLTSLADRASSDFRRWNCRQSQPATPSTRECCASEDTRTNITVLLNNNTGYVIFLFYSWSLTRTNETGLCWRAFFLTSDEQNPKENKLFKSYDALIKGACHPQFLNIHISHIMRTSMCSRHLWQELSYCLTVTLVTGYLAHSCFAFARDPFRNQIPGVWSRRKICPTSGLLNVRSKFPALGISEKCRSEGSEERHHPANKKIHKQSSHFVKQNVRFCKS